MQVFRVKVRMAAHFLLAAVTITLFSSGSCKKNQRLPLLNSDTTLSSSHLPAHKAGDDLVPFGVNLAGAEFSEDNLPGVFGQNYFYPTTDELDYFKSKGLMLVRLPFKWERVQHTLNGPLNPAELGRMKAFISAAESRGMMILLDMHNYGRRRIGEKNVVIGSKELTISHVADVWAKIADELKGFTNIWGYGLMNEPYGMLPEVPWATIAQNIINEIRKADTKTSIVVGGNSWSSAARWRQASDELKHLQDPSDNIIYEAHLYFDKDASGTYAGTYESEGGTPMRGVERAYHFAGWLNENNKKGFIGEYGIPSDDKRWLATLDNLLNYLVQNKINGAYWAAGPNWGAYKLSVEPDNGKDKPQMSILSKYPYYERHLISENRIISRDKNVMVTASGYLNASESPHKANDGNYITKWCDNVSRDKWLQYDFGKQASITGIMVEWEGYDVTKKFKLQTSSDGLVWTDAVSENNNTEPLRVFPLEIASARFIRLYVNASDDDVVRLIEMEVWGKLLK